MRSSFLFLALVAASFLFGPAPAAASMEENFYYRHTDPALPVFGDPRVLTSNSTTRKAVSYQTQHKPGTIVIDTNERKLYLVQEGGRALSYGVGVGRPGFTWQGTHRVTRKAEWPDWYPPAEMRKRQPYLPLHMPGGPDNPLGARALYLGSTLYRIHGTSEANTIGTAISSGCFRMLNKDVIDLYERVQVGAQVVVLR